MPQQFGIAPPDRLEHLVDRLADGQFVLGRVQVGVALAQRLSSRLVSLAFILSFFFATHFYFHEMVDTLHGYSLFHHTPPKLSFSR